MVFQDEQGNSLSATLKNKGAVSVPFFLTWVRQMSQYCSGLGYFSSFQPFFVPRPIIATHYNPTTPI